MVSDLLTRGTRHARIALLPCEKFHKLPTMKDPTSEEFYRVLGARVRALRAGRLSQGELALKVGLTRTSIVNIEGGAQKMLVHNLFRIAEALAVKPTELLAPLEPSHSSMATFSPPEGSCPTISDWLSRSVAKAMNSSA